MARHVHCCAFLCLEKFVKKILVLALMACGSAMSANATTIATTYDVSVYNQAPTNSYVNGGYAGSTNNGDIAYDYLQFALGGQTSGTATLTLHYQTPYQGLGTLGIFAAATDAWGNSITWNHQPGLGALITTFAPSVNGSTYTLDVSSFVDSQTDGIASFVIATSNNTDSWRYLAGGTETLTVSAPEPAMAGLFGIGAIGLCLSRRRRPA
jgi:hypothetical protein